MKVSIVTIGDEILIGQIIDTNSAWIAQRLNEIGLRVNMIFSISDVEAEIINTLDIASDLSDIVLITGGLGPTRDDVTKSTLAKYFNDVLVRSDQVLDHIKSLFLKYGVVEINDLNIQQSDVPSKCKVLINPVGTASGMWFERDGKHFISMPGVPHEMKAIMNASVLPKFKSKFSKGVFMHKTLLTQGVPESVLAELIEPWELSLPKNVKLAYLPSENRVRLRLSIEGESHQEMEKVLESAVNALKIIIPDYIYGEENDSVEQRVGTLLKENKATVATAESCTGGYLAHLITSIAGSSAYFKGSVLAYDNTIKEEVLQVSSKSLCNFGAVSKQVVEEMAFAAKELMQTDYALATSGIAGPTGGTEEKPVGTVWTAIAGPNGVCSVKYQFGSERMWNVRRSANAVLLDFLHLLESNDKKVE